MQHLKKDAKLYVPVITLWIEDDNKLLEHLKSGFKRTMEQNGINTDQKWLNRLTLTTQII